MPKQSNDPLVWIDCEMTGLDSSSSDPDTILSVACFVTDGSLALLDSTGFEATVLHTKAQLDKMGEWCTATHGASGLTAACLDATRSQSAEDVAGRLLEYIRRYVPEPKLGLLAGNSVHCDKMFLVKEPWAKVLEHLHYRILDVSAIKEAARRWAPPARLKGVPRKAGKHEARADILESIEEARFFQAQFFAA